MNNRNKLLADIVIAAGGTVTDPNNRNQLLQDWLDASGGEVGSEFLDEGGFMYASSELNQNSEIWSNV